MGGTAGHAGEGATPSVPPRTDRVAIGRREFALGCGSAALGLALPGLGRAAPGATPARVLYIAGHVNPALVEKLGPTQFNVAILAFVYARHTQREGLQLNYNGVPAARLPRTLPEQLQRLRGGFGVRKRVLVSLGGWGNRGTFEALRAAGVEKSLAQLDREIIGPLGLDGIDLDLEPSTKAENTAAGWHAVHDDLGATLVELTNGYMRRHPGHVVTHAPIASVAAALYVRDGGVRGVKGSLFEATRSREGNHIGWLNVQFYEAGDPKPVSIPDFYQKELIEPLLAQAAATGVTRPWERLLPGFEPRYRQDLGFCERTLEGINRGLGGGRGVGGVFLWQYGQIAPHVADWGAGLERSLLTRT